MIRLCPGWSGLRLYFALLLVVLPLAIPGVGQTLEVQNPGTGVIPLDKDWRFHLGDDKAWADPALDESNWERGHPGFAFYTDGIVEARNATGELYGFERLAALLRSDPSVEQMVEQACAFGQQDDITVFKVTRLAQSAPAHAARLSLATQISHA